MVAVYAAVVHDNGSLRLQKQPDPSQYEFRLVLNFERRQMTKFVEASIGNTLGYHLVVQ